MNGSETCTQCPVCGGTPRVAFALRDGRREMRCCGCGLFFYWPLPSESEQKAFYDAQWAEESSEYHAHYDDAALEDENLRNNFIPRLELLANRGFSGNLLDVGCSVGTFLRAAKERGWNVQGIDLGEAACARTAAAIGCPVHCGVLEEAALPGASFDVIHASQVIEHVMEPKRFLSAARRLLRPGGALLLAAPIIAPSVYRTTHFVQKTVVPAVSRGREYPYPWAIHHPFHVYAHSPASLRLLVESSGFRIVHVRVVRWQSFARLNVKWRVFYRLMNGLFRVLRTGMNMDILAVKT
ncbi:MAG TPA: methyltransferase domain-containing protein [Candidatus Hydrogenedentes bacterium]|nr:methyltransferase domain-containing protein [Candidatus Hydrogenedentota bacterium]HPC18026.1 methyltransferase domain-containing protein [Candidatus Hydrogenedentota bacterium]HRT21973.1 methyltransferase domain-containing protein [Candidatus Hydrogenedentota bacterium]HRT66669.1 methyltransferase domain-containing protein [Candidatus Hydrogenedentota bacterium]